MTLAYADTGFLASLYLEETTSTEAEAIFAAHGAPLTLTPLVLLELRNAFNLAVNRGRITIPLRNALWSRFEVHLAAGVFVLVPIDSAELYRQARELSDRHTAREASRTLDLLHVAAALNLGVRGFFTFDRRQHAVAKSEGLKLSPARLRTVT
jgi:predicted nucleic acid-binding protein